MRWLIVLGLLTSCVVRENDCNYCVKFCNPYGVAVCDQGPFGVTCSCDARMPRLQCPDTIRSLPKR